MEKIKEYNVDLRKTSLNSFIKDIENIFGGFDKIEVRKRGLKRLLQAVYEKGSLSSEERILKILDERLLPLKVYTKEFEDAYEKWNNKKLKDDIRKLNERICDEMTDNGTSPVSTELAIEILEELKQRIKSK